MASNYKPGIPTGLVNLSTDYQNIQGNFQQLDTTFGVDHTTFSNETGQNGYHTIIHQLPASTPGAISEIGQVFQKLNTDGFNGSNHPTLYFLSDFSGALPVQFTRNINLINNTPGFSWIAGGILQLWGYVSKPGTTSGTVTFSLLGLPNFQVKAFTVSFSLTRNGGVAGADAVWLNNGDGSSPPNQGLTTGGFNWKSSSSLGSNGDGFFWFAIGN